MESKYINDAMPTYIWHGISGNALIHRCGQATADEARCMSHVVALMMACEPITWIEWIEAERAFNSVERRLVESFTGPLRLNKRGLHFGMIHPALTV